MKRILKSIVLAVAMFFTANAFAADLDFSTFWKEYGTGYEAGQMFVGGDIGVSQYTGAKHGSGSWYSLPQFGGTFDMIMPLDLSKFSFITSESMKSLVLPLSVGGNVNLNMFGCKDPSLSYTSLMIDGVAKYHVNIADVFKTVEALNKLDVYAGLRLGFNMVFTNNKYAKNKFGMDFGILLGGNYFFTEQLAANVEFGLAPYMKAGVLYRIK